MTSTTSTGEVHEAAERLLAAHRTRTTCPPVRNLLSDSTASTGYRIQSLLTRARLDAGHAPTGRKIGLTSPGIRAQLGVDQPDFGVLFDDMTRTQDTPIDSGPLLQPRIEAEIAFVLGSDLDGGDADEARAAVDFVAPALEIADSRIAEWDITFVDTVADNASSGLYVLGEDRRELGDRDLRAVEMTMTDAGGGTRSSGNGAACLGDPINALSWLARAAREFGTPLRAGDVVLSGALGPMVPVLPGDEFKASLTGLGEVRASFTPS